MQIAVSTKETSQDMFERFSKALIDFLLQPIKHKNMIFYINLNLFALSSSQQQTYSNRTRRTTNDKGSNEGNSTAENFFF